MTDQKKTLAACFLGYITQAIVVNLTPILFIVFISEYGISYEKLGRLVLFNFLSQIIADLVTVKTIDRVGYRAAGVAAHLLSVAGLCLMAFLPFIIEPYAGLTLAVIVFAFGGGVIEVIISPITDAMPSDAKASRMSLLHSFYCWGQMAVVIVTTLLLSAIGARLWFILPLCWSAVPLYNTLRFLRVPLPDTAPAHERTPLKRLFGSKAFITSLMMMMLAGASELTMSQWSSLFAENALGVSKVMGDLLGPCLFAFFMGAGRTAYGVWGRGVRLKPALLLCGVLCVACYAAAVFAKHPASSLMGCALCGLSVSLMWPGTLSLSSERFPGGGAAMFGLFAVFGDIGASVGPWFSGLISDMAGRGGAAFFSAAGGGSALKAGLLAGMIFPLMMTVCVLTVKENKRERSER